MRLKLALIASLMFMSMAHAEEEPMKITNCEIYSTGKMLPPWFDVKPFHVPPNQKSLVIKKADYASFQVIESGKTWVIKLEERKDSHG